MLILTVLTEEHNVMDVFLIKQRNAALLKIHSVPDVDIVDNLKNTVLLSISPFSENAFFYETVQMVL